MDRERPDVVCLQELKAELAQIPHGVVNIARTEMDVHPRERKSMAVGQRPEERALFETLLGTGLTDVGRVMDPDNSGLFTWWAPWRNLRPRNIGWRLDCTGPDRIVTEG